MAIKFLSDINADGANTDINVDGAIKFDDVTIIDTNATYTRIANPEGANCLYLGDGGDRQNYYDNNTHRFRSFGGSTEYMRINSTGVGIGTNNPAAKLDVRTADGNSDSLQIGRIDNANFWKFNHAGNDLRIYNTASSGSDILLGVNAGGTAQANKVGIGTATPSEVLHVNGRIKGDKINLGDGLVNFPALYFAADTNTGIYRPAGDNLGVAVGGNLRFLVKNSFNDAITVNSTSNSWTIGNYDSAASSITSLINGSTFGALIKAPNSGQFVLQLLNNDNDDSFSVISDADNAAGAPDRLVFRVKAQGNGYFPAAGARVRVGDGSTGGGIRFGNDTDTNAITYASSQLQIRTAQSQGITFKTTSSSTERMRITDGGNVGIGTTNPSYLLDVNGDARIDNIYLKRDIIHSGDTDTNIQFDTNRVRIYAGGNLKFDSNNTYLTTAGGSLTGDLTLASNTTLHIGNVDLTTGSGGNTVSVEAATSSGTAMNFKTSSGTVAAYMVYQGTTTTRFAGRVEPSGNRTLDLGTDALRWRVVYCETLDSAGQHESNLQDREQPVGQYITGTVLAWKNGKNRPCTQFADHMRMGIAVLGQDSPLVQGAEPVLCTGIVEEGDYLVTSEKEGHAVAIPRHIVKEQLLFDCVIGKALQDGEGVSLLIKTWINI